MARLQPRSNIFENSKKTDIISQIVRQTPSLVRESEDVDFTRKMGTSSARIFSPNLRHSSAVVRPAVYNRTI